MSNSYEAGARSIARSVSNAAFFEMTAAGISEGEAAEAASRIYEAEYRHELQDIYGEDFREDDHEPDPDPEEDE